MKVKVVLSVDVDPASWVAAYGEDPVVLGDEVLADEVRRYVIGLVAGAEATRRGALVGVRGRSERQTAD